MSRPPAPEGPRSLDDRTARLTVLYIAALSTVAMLSILGQALVQWSLSRQASDSAVVNIAGRQRMLSQKLAKEAIVFHHAASQQQRLLQADKIRSTLALWKHSHEGLQQRGSAVDLPGRNSPAVTALFAEISVPYSAIRTAASQLSEASTTNALSQAEVSRLVTAILANESKFLVGMDSIVASYELEARGRVTRLQTIERVLLVVTLLVLLCEGAIVFRPAVAHVRRAAGELLKSRQELEVAKEAAEAANRQKTEFLANISHELRNPLHAVLGNLELLQRTELDDRQHGYLKTADDSARSLEQLLSDLLDMSRIESGHLSLSRAPFSLQELLDRCLAMHQAPADAKGIRLRREFSATDIWINGDSLRLRQILVNLLGNAIKFTERGEVLLRVFPVPERTDEGGVPRIRFEAVDTGIGISPEHQSRIFDAFVQVDASSRREHRGAGLGLAITSRLATMMGGTCGVVSEIGEGSTFWVELPLEPAQPPNLPQSARLDDDNSMRGAFRSLKVLVVDDDEVNRQLVVESLLILGHHSVTAADGITAVQKAKDESFDAILLDLHLPQLDGYEVARQIREFTFHRSRKPAIIALSAASALLSTGGEGGHFDRVLTKPAGVRQIGHALREVNASVRTTQAAHVQVSGPGFCVSTYRCPEQADRWNSVLERLQGRHELFCDLARLFLDGIAVRGEEIEAALERNDFNAAVRSAHTLRGQAATFAANELVIALRQFEEAALAEDPAGSQASLPGLLHGLHQLGKELRTALPLFSRSCAAVR